MSKRRLRIYAQFCYECGSQFLRRDYRPQPPILCGLCQHQKTLAFPGLSRIQRDYAEHSLASWFAHQTALRVAIGDAPPDDKPVPYRPVEGNPDDLPF